MKRFLSLAISFIIISGSFSYMPGITIEAEAETDYWDGSVATGFAGGNGGELYPYEINTAEQLAYLAELINSEAEDEWGWSYRSQDYILTSDIVLNINGETTHEWISIGSSIEDFNGTFDGDGHTISGMYTEFVDSEIPDELKDKNMGLLGHIGSRGIVRDLGLINSTISYHSDIYEDGGKTIIGCIADENDGSILNCYSSGEISADSYTDYMAVGGLIGLNSGTISNSNSSCNIIASESSYHVIGGAGGVVGYNKGLLSECYYTGTVTGLCNGAGGIAGENSTYYNSDVATIKNCYNIGTVYGADYVGGIAGINDEESIIINSQNSGGISIQEEGMADIGGIAGRNLGEIFNSENNSSNIGSNVTDFVTELSMGGIVGNNWGGRIDSCKNTADLTSGIDGSIGGIAGWNTDNLDECPGIIVNCSNEGSLSAELNSYGVGGIVGTNYNGNIWLCQNSGSISGFNSAGISESNNENGWISNCYNNGEITGEFSNGIVEGNHGLVENCYNSGNVFADCWASGIVYGNYGQISNCYNIGTVSGQEWSVGVVGDNWLSEGGKVINCYYLIGSAPDTYVDGGGVDSLTSNQMKTNDFASNLNTTNGLYDSSGAWVLRSDINNGYPTLTNAIGSGAITVNNSFLDYYGETVAKMFRIIDLEAGYPPATGFDILVDGVTYNSGDSGDINIDIPVDYEGDVVISKLGYYTYTISMDRVSSYNVVTMVKDSGDDYPVVQSVLMNKSSESNKRFVNLRVDQAGIYEGSLTASEILVDIDWNGNPEGDVWLQQGDVTVPIVDGTTGEIALGVLFNHEGGPAYVCANSGSKTITVHFPFSFVT